MVYGKDYYINNFMSGKDIYLNYLKWISGDKDKLFIIGLSGSGKSTLSDKLAKKFKCEIVHTDLFRGNIYYTDKEMMEKSPLILKYFTDIWEYGDRRNVSKMEREIRKEEYKKMFYWLVSLPERIIIEGEIEDFLADDNKLKTYPIIFKGTSMLKSMSRMLKREITRDHKNHTSVDTILWIIRWCTKYNEMKNKHNEKRNQIMRYINDEDYEEHAEY